MGKEKIAIYGTVTAAVTAVRDEMKSKARCNCQHSQYFDGKPLDVDAVIVIGDAPVVVKAYEAAEIPVEVVKVSDVLGEDDTETTSIDSPEDIDKLKKADVIEYLAAHGVEDASGKVDELRDQLKKIMFVDSQD